MESSHNTQGEYGNIVSWLDSDRLIKKGGGANFCFRRLKKRAGLYRGTGGHRQDTETSTSQVQIATPTRSVTYYTGLTDFGLDCMAPGFHT
ncbi:hypothetical protein A3194_19340 [Candidatus Thiodiazotropha endoloripes]|nr:hypothetical protein A3194_19340 [Candidatus Thiodiazotropha endoloripes]